MKNLKFKSRFNTLMGVFLYFLNVNVEAQVQPVTIYFAGNDVNNLVPFIRRVAISTKCGPGVREITTDILGRKASEIELCNGKRCGLTKIYKAGVLVKEINYLNDFVISYKSYNNGVLVTEINADRSRVVFQGALVPLNWKRIYVKYNRNRIVMVTKGTFIDNLLKFQIPENVAAIMKDIDSQAGLNGVTGSNAVFNCDDSYSRVNDSDIKLHGTTSSEKSTAQSFINNLGSTCSALTRSKVNDDFNGKTGDAAKEARKAAASSRLDKMISACQDRANSPGLFENPIIIGEAILLGLETVLEGAAVAEVTTGGAAVATEIVGATIIDATIIDGTATALTSQAATTVVSETAITTASSALNATLRTLPALTETAEVSSASNISTVGIAKFVMTVSAVVAAIGGTSANAAEPPMEICEVETDSNNDPNGQTMIDANQGQTPATQSPTTGSTTPDQAAGDNCARLVRFRDYCNNNGWQTLECQDAMGLLTGCGTADPRIIYVSPQGEPTGSGCYSVSKAQAAALECKKRSLIASYLNGNNICPSKGGFDLRSLVKDPGWIDPSPIDGRLYHNSFAKIFKGTKVTVMEGLTLKQLQSNLPFPSVQNLVVFMDADCPASISYAKTLASKELNDAIPKGVNIVVVDVASDPAIANKYNIVGYPTSFLMSSTGKLSLPMLGALTVQETVTTMLSK